MKIKNMRKIEIALAMAQGTNSVPCRWSEKDGVFSLELCGWGNANMMLSPGLSGEELEKTVKRIICRSF